MQYAVTLFQLEFCKLKCLLNGHDIEMISVKVQILKEKMKEWD